MEVARRRERVFGAPRSECRATLVEISAAGLHQGTIEAVALEAVDTEPAADRPIRHYFNLSIHGALISFGVLRSGNDSRS